MFVTKIGGTGVKMKHGYKRSNISKSTKTMCAWSLMVWDLL